MTSEQRLESLITRVGEKVGRDPSFCPLTINFLCVFRVIGALGIIWDLWPRSLLESSLNSRIKYCEQFANGMMTKICIIPNNWNLIMLCYQCVHIVGKDDHLHDFSRNSKCKEV